MTSEGWSVQAAAHGDADAEENTAVKTADEIRDGRGFYTADGSLFHTVEVSSRAASDGLPRNWSYRKIGDICRVTSGGTPDRKKAQYWGGDIPWIRTTEVQNCVIRESDVKEFITLSGLKASSARIVPAGSVLIAMVGQGKTRGQVALLTFDAAINQNCAALVFGPESSPVFYFNYLRSRYEHIRKLSNSAGQSNLSGGLVKTIRVPAPPLYEQQKIADILTTWDRAIAIMERLVENSRVQKKALIRKLLPGKERLPGFNSQWKAVQLTQMARILVSNVDKKTRPGEQAIRLCNYTDVYYNDHITNDLNFMGATASSEQIRKFRLKPDDVIITKDSETPGDIAVAAVVSEPLDNVICGYHLAIIRPDPARCSGRFLANLMALPRVRYYFASLANGATRFGLTVGAIEKARFALPDVEEQQAIEHVIETASVTERKLISRLESLRREKAALMQQLLTGRRRVNLQEVASVPVFT